MIYIAFLKRKSTFYFAQSFASDGKGGLTHDELARKYGIDEPSYEERFNLVEIDDANTKYVVKGILDFTNGALGVDSALDTALKARFPRLTTYTSSGVHLLHTSNTTTTTTTTTTTSTTTTHTTT